MERGAGNQGITSGKFKVYSKRQIMAFLHYVGQSQNSDEKPELYVILKYPKNPSFPLLKNQIK